MSLKSAPSMSPHPELDTPIIGFALGLLACLACGLVGLILGAGLVWLFRC